MISRPVRSSLSLYVVVLVLLLLGYISIHAYAASIRISLFHLDGAYQTYSALNRLAIGHRPGVEFFPYLGIGISGVLYPLFAALGGTVFASNIAAEISSLTAFAFTSTWLSWLCLSLLLPRVPTLTRSAAALSISALLVVVSQYLQAGSAVWFLSVLQTAGNSLLPVRSLLPALVSLAFYAAIQPRCSPVMFAVYSGAIPSFFLLWSNDYAYTSFALFYMYLAFFSIHRPYFRTGVKITAAIIGAILAYFFILTVITAGNPWQFLAYNFDGVAREQFWYFGPYQEGSRYFGLTDIVFYWNRASFIALILISSPFLIAAGTMISVVTGNRHLASLMLLASTALAAGFLSEYGGHKGYRYYALTSLVWFFAMISIVLIISARSFIFLRRYFTGASNALGLLRKIKWPKVKYGTVGVACVTILAITSGLVYLSILDYVRINRVKFDSSYTFISELGGFIPTQYGSEYRFRSINGTDDSKQEHFYLSQCMGYNDRERTNSSGRQHYSCAITRS